MRQDRGRRREPDAQSGAGEALDALGTASSKSNDSDSSFKRFTGKLLSGQRRHQRALNSEGNRF